MPLNKPKLENSIQILLQDMMTKESDSIQEFAQRLANSIDEFIRSASVVVPAGIPVSTAGTAVAQTGATTAPITASIQ